MVIFAQPHAQAGPPAGVLEALFDLTPAEARVAHGVGAGHSVEDVARAQGLSEATIRTQLKAVFAKVGVDRQAALVRLVSGFSSFSLPGGGG